jgi:hypothetical protein
VLILALIHEWSFFLVVGPEFQLFLTPTDYIDNAIIWIPAALILLALFAVINGILSAAYMIFGYVRNSGHAHNNFQADGSITPSTFPTPRARFVLFITAFLLGIFLLLFYDSYDRYLGAIMIVVVSIWYGYTLWIRYTSTMYALTFRMVLGIVLIFILMILPFQVGRMEAYYRLIAFYHVYAIKTKTDDSERHYLLLRNLSRGVLVRDAVADRILFIKWDDIVIFSSKTPVPDTAILACSWFGIKCPAPTIIP